MNAPSGSGPYHMGMTIYLLVDGDYLRLVGLGQFLELEQPSAKDYRPATAQIVMRQGDNEVHKPIELKMGIKKGETIVWPRRPSKEDLEDKEAQMERQKEFKRQLDEVTELVKSRGVTSEKLQQLARDLVAESGRIYRFNPPGHKEFLKTLLESAKSYIERQGDISVERKLELFGSAAKAWWVAAQPKHLHRAYLAKVSNIESSILRAIMREMKAPPDREWGVFGFDIVEKDGKETVEMLCTDEILDGEEA